MIANDLNKKFSWLRVSELTAYYKPLLSGQVLIYAGISLFLAVLILLPVGDIAQIFFLAITWTIIPYMFQFAPLVFAKGGDARLIERMIPATAAEKMTFLLIYLLVVIGAVVYALPEFSLWLYTKIPAIQNEKMLIFVNLRLSNSEGVVIMNSLSVTAAMLTCLYMVLRARSNRIIKGIVSVFAVQFSLAFLGGLYGIRTAFQKGFEDGMANRLPMGMNLSVEQIRSISADFSVNNGFVIFVICLLACYSLYMVWLNYRVFRKGNC